MPAVRYIPRKVSEIEQNDTRIAVTGRIAEGSRDSFVLDDSSGKIEVFLQVEGTDRLDAKVGKDDLVRVFCTVIGAQLKADAVQNLNGLDAEQLKKIEELYNKAGI